MGVTVTAIDRARPGREKALDAEVAGHVPDAATMSTEFSYVAATDRDVRP